MTRTSDPPARARRRLDALAFDAGLDVVGVASADALQDAPARFDEFLALGRHGEMDWLAARAEERRSPRTLWPSVRTVIMIGQSYAPTDDPLAFLADKTRAGVSVYAQRRDYHDVVKKRLKRLARGLIEEFGGDVKVFVDTAPVLEKPLAAAAGLGWQGKHTNLVSRAHGSWLFLGAIYATLDIAVDAPHADRCGRCRRCLDVCPTDAFPAPYQLDARRCVAYLTIEHKGPIPHELRKGIGNRVFGCDDCLAVCPWNKFAAAARDARLAAEPHLAGLRLADLAALDDADFRTLFAGTPVKRTGRDRFIRNVMIAIGNSADPELAATARARLDDASPLVRGAAAWAVRRLLAADEVAAIAAERRAVETDDAVRREWSEPLK